MDKKLVEFVRRWSNAIGLSIQYIIVGLFSRLLPLVSGGLFGIGVYAFWMAETGNVALSAIMAVFTAGGVEAVGFMASHRAIKSYEQKRPLQIPLVFVSIYIIIGGGALWFTDVNLAHKIITTAVFLLVAVDYALLGMETVERVDRRTERNAEQRANELADEDREFAREMKRAALVNRQAVKMAKVSAPVKVVSPSAVTTSPSAVQSSDTLSEAYKAHFITLHGIGREFTTAQARDVLGLSPKGTGNVLSSAIDYEVLDKVKRGVYSPNGVDPSIL